MDRARLILLLIFSVPWPFATNIETRYLNLSTSSKGSRSSRTAGRRSPGMSADIALVFEALMRTPTAAHLAVATAECCNVVGIGEVGHMDVGSNLNPWVIL